MHANIHVVAHSRSAGKNAAGASAYRAGSVVAAAAYRSGERLDDERACKIFNYENKQGILHSEIIAPDNAPAWMHDREKLWNGVEASEKRKDALLAKEFVLVLPRNLNHEQHKELVRGFVHDNLTARGLVADVAFHSPDASDGEKNHHAHILFTCRGVDDSGRFGKKQTGYKELDNGYYGLDGKNQLNEWRKSYEFYLNQASENAGSDIRFDLRSYHEKGMNRIPEPKLGPVASALEKQGIQTERGNWRRHVQAHNFAYNPPKRKHIDTYKQIGSNTRSHAFVLDCMRNDLHDTYHDFFYGGGTEGHNPEPNDFYGHERH